MEETSNVFPIRSVVSTPQGAAGTPILTERFERAIFKKNYVHQWVKTVYAPTEQLPGGLTELRLTVWGIELELVRTLAIAKRTEHFDEAAVSEAICECIFDPRLLEG